MQNEDEYDEYSDFADDLGRRAWDNWSYIDGRDVGTAVEAAVHQTQRGFHPYLIVADDTVMPIRTADIIAARYPNTPVRGPIDTYGALLSNQRARDEMNWAPQHSWRQHVPASN